MNAPHPDSEPRRGPIAWMAGHSVAANLVMLICLIGGYMALRNVKQEVFPEIETDMVTVQVAYPGASPEEIESGVVLVVEEAIRGLEGIDEVTSVAAEGSATITAELLLGEDPQVVAQDIQSEVDRIRTFPEEAEEPEVSVVARKREVIDLALYGSVSDRVLHQLGERVRDLLLQKPQITQVELEGLPNVEIAVEIPQENLRRYGLTLGEVARRLRDASVDLPGGGVKTDAGEVLLRVKERRDYGWQFARLPIVTTADGTEVRLEDIAVVEDAFADTDRAARYNGKPALVLEIFRVGEQTPLDVAGAVHAAMGEIDAALPAGVGAAILRDRSEIYAQRVELLLRNGGIGLGLVLIVLGLFLEARLAFWVMMGIPISFLASFLVLPATGVTINMMSLFAYIIALGIVVDDAIVVGENIYHYHQEGLPLPAAAVRGAREVAIPVTFSILTNVVAFLPIALVPGFTGKIFRMIPVVVCTVFIISLFESLFILPAHLGRHGRRSAPRGVRGWLHARQQGFSRAFRGWVERRYGPLLEGAIRFRYVTVAIAAAVLMLSVAYAASGRMGFQLFPVVESDRSEASVVMPYGTPVEKTEAVMERLLRGARAVQKQSGSEELVTSITADIGRRGGHTGTLRVELAEAEVRETIMSTAEFTRRWREQVGPIAGVESLRFAADAGGPGSRGQPVTVELSHRSVEVLEQASKTLAATLATYPRTRDVDDGFQPGKPQFDFTLTPEGKSLGLTARSVARQVRDAFYGAEALRQQRGRDEVRLMVRLPERQRSTEQTLEDLMVRTPAGTFVPLREAAVREQGRAYTTIDRRKGRRVVQVAADVVPRSKAGEVLADLRENVMPGLLRRYPGLTYSFEGHQASITESLDSLKVTFPIALLVIFALLAIPFRSYVQPLIVMLAIPFGIVGAVLGHLIMGYGLCIPSMFGIVALAGVVVNDSLVLVDFANRRRREGLSYHEAIHAAGIQRFRPVVLTTLTTFGGLAPMIFETSRQARFMIPMALSLGFGILFATGITLLLVPALYCVIEDAARISAGAKRIAEVSSP